MLQNSQIDQFVLNNKKWKEKRECFRFFLLNYLMNDNNQSRSNEWKSAPTSLGFFVSTLDGASGKMNGFRFGKNIFKFIQNHVMPLGISSFQFMRSAFRECNMVGCRGESIIINNFPNLLLSVRSFRIYIWTRNGGRWRKNQNVFVIMMDSIVWRKYAINKELTLRKILKFLYRNFITRSSTHSLLDSTIQMKQ